MNDFFKSTAISHPVAQCETGQPIWYEAALLGGQLANNLRQQLVDQQHAEPIWLRTLSFLTSQAQYALQQSPAKTPQPLDDLARALSLSAEERLLVVLAGMAEEHEGYAAAFSAIHPSQESRPTLGIFARLVFSEASREQWLQLLESTLLTRIGVVRANGHGPLPEQSISLAPKLWQVLHGIDAWPDEIMPLAIPLQAAFLDTWLASRKIEYVQQTFASDLPSVIVLEGEAAALRAQQLTLSTDYQCHCFTPQVLADVQWLQTALTHCLVRRAIPVLLNDNNVTPMPEISLSLESYPGPLVLAGLNNAHYRSLDKPIVAVDAPALSRNIQRELWRSGSSQLAAHAESLSVGFPSSPHIIARTQQDLEHLKVLGNAKLDLEDCIQALHYRVGSPASLYARTTRPKASWDDLVLPREKSALLQDAVARVRHQYQVLDEWGFEQGRYGRRGLRLLFSGLPGTGKTLAAEVIAKALHGDLIAVDLARVVSKWIGETEKNLAAVFDQAEATRAILFFDEADALFGKRTEVSDAHDRYANIETAYLLARLEHYDGVTILATNLRQNLDKAFIRRFEFIIDFPEPDVEERLLIWQKHIPKQAPVDSDVNFCDLAGRYQISGAMIRNAALSAAFHAAEDGGEIRYQHFERAVRQEYAKAGRTCPKY